MRKLLIVFSIIFSLSFAEEILNLDDCIKIAIENNLKLKIKKSKIVQTFYQKEIARKYLLPSLSFSFNYKYLGDNEGVNFGNFGPIKFTDDNLYTFTFTLKQPLFTGRKIESAYKVAQENYEKSEIDYEKEITDLILDVKKNYFNILKAKRFVETSKKYKENLEKHLIDAKKMFEQGIVTKLDVLKTEVVLKNIETKIIESEN
ncbi:MAG: TolC family protein, partial [Candidatus Omnitrophica bacterium]|nr:TolC family protein [Candidatus Omnitrophota bacterium]